MLIWPPILNGVGGRFVAEDFGLVRVRTVEALPLQHIVLFEKQ